MIKLFGLKYQFLKIGISFAVHYIFKSTAYNVGEITEFEVKM